MLDARVCSDPVLGEECHEFVLENGLKILVCPKKGYRSAYALYGTRYGSVDSVFKAAGEPQFTTVPEGIAHFLEHKLFESEEGDVFTRFAETGASANAYTSFDRTCYLFSCSAHFDDSFDILLDFVQHPYFTEQTVQKEQGIIGQEIRMYDDQPSWRVFFNLLTALYRNHPVRIDIAGTVDSIAKIDAELLYRCYNVFYNPANMFVCVAGNVDPQKIAEKVRTSVKTASAGEIVRGEIREPDEVVRSQIEQRLAVSVPLFTLGYKEPCGAGFKTPAERMAAEVLLEAVAGNASELYRSLFDDGLINENFSTEYFHGPGYAAFLFAGESKDPEEVRRRIDAELERVRTRGLSGEDFENARRKLYGRGVAAFNSPHAIGSALVQCAVAGEELFDECRALREMTPESVMARLERIGGARSALSVILPA